MTKTSDALAQTEDFWRHFYAHHSLRHDPSPFARWCLENHLKSDDRIFELGCGNGRDSFAFLHHGLPVLAIDGCDVAIADNVAHYIERDPQAVGYFHALNFSDLWRLTEIVPDVLLKINTVYTRFVLHAIPEVLEDHLLDFCQHILPIGGRMLHEFRTIHDSLMQRGIVLSSNERLTDHYRRFIDPDAFRAKLKSRGWQETYFDEDQGLATFGVDDPMVARIIVEKI
jgi:SAM-dependent methyltransferase